MAAKFFAAASFIITLHFMLQTVEEIRHNYLDGNSFELSIDVACATVLIM